MQLGEGNNLSGQCSISIGVNTAAALSTICASGCAPPKDLGCEAMLRNVWLVNSGGEARTTRLRLYPNPGVELHRVYRSPQTANDPPVLNKLR